MESTKARHRFIERWPQLPQTFVHGNQFIARITAKKSACDDDPVAGLVVAGDLHAALVDEGAQQAVQRLHDVGVAVDLERAVPLDARACPLP